MCLESAFSNSYHSIRYELHRIYMQYDNAEEAKAPVPENVAQDTWLKICESFEDDKRKVNLLKLNWQSI